MSNLLNSVNIVYSYENVAGENSVVKLFNLIKWILSICEINIQICEQRYQTAVEQLGLKEGT